MLNKPTVLIIGQKYLLRSRNSSEFLAAICLGQIWQNHKIVKFINRNFTTNVDKLSAV